ncbi:uncharacterized protein LOC109823209 [Asparagus officinalis]|uniref:uncharacterized protein LOC109823209 n=1 Tax=Asparagus officinalis TaxID=4686 RepID=UPI00098E3300|nr:uncharacterized protein LOC109823209 [Asparagus officinalis]
MEIGGVAAHGTDPSACWQEDQQEATSLGHDLNARPSVGLESADGELDRNLPSSSLEIEEQHEELADSNSGVERATTSTDAPLPETSNADSNSGVERATTSADDPLPETSNADSNSGVEGAATSIGEAAGKDSQLSVRGDMLAVLGKDCQLSVRGVCALYRQQSFEEKFAHRALERNNKGFSIADTKLASCYAKFMLGEQTNGDIQRSVRELDRSISILHVIRRLNKMGITRMEITLSDTAHVSQ